MISTVSRGSPVIGRRPRRGAGACRAAACVPSVTGHDLAQHGVSDGAVGEPVDGCNHRHLRRIPGDSAPATCRQLGEPAIELLHQIGPEPELDRPRPDQRAVVELAGDEQRLRPAVRAAADAGDHEPLVSAELVLDPRGASPARRVARVEALGDDALQTELGDFRDECLRPLETMLAGVRQAGPSSASSSRRARRSR